MPRKSLRVRVEDRAQKRCEYRHAAQRVCGYRFHLEHIVPLVAGGSDTEDNRALACASCNPAKSEHTTGRDPLTSSVTPLFNPRAQSWQEHFAWAEDQRTLIGQTPTGRATIAALNMNSELRLTARSLWFASGWLP